MRTKLAPVGVEAFDLFWAAFPKHDGKHDALKAWTALRPSALLATQILLALEWQVRLFDWTKERGRFVPLPASYLRGRRWEDEPPRGFIAGRPQYRYPCPHTPGCAGTWSCCKRQDTEREA